MLQTAFRIASALTMALIVVLSVVPPSVRPVTAAPHSIEHLAIFAISGALLGLAFPGRWLVRLSVLVLMAAAIELVQLWIPGRHARVSDLVENVLGSGLGLALSFVAYKLRIDALWEKPARRLARVKATANAKPAVEP